MYSVGRAGLILMEKRDGQGCWARLLVTEGSEERSCLGLKTRRKVMGEDGPYRVTQEHTGYDFSAHIFY